MKAIRMIAGVVLGAVTAAPLSAQITAVSKTNGCYDHTGLLCTLTSSKTVVASTTSLLTGLVQDKLTFVGNALTSNVFFTNGSSKAFSLGTVGVESGITSFVSGTVSRKLTFSLFLDQHTTITYDKLDVEYDNVFLGALIGGGDRFSFKGGGISDIFVVGQKSFQFQVAGVGIGSSTDACASVELLPGKYYSSTKSLCGQFIEVNPPLGVPEPASIGLVLAGLFGVGVVRRRSGRHS